MLPDFINTLEFDKRWVALKLNEDNYHLLQIELLKNPKRGPVIIGTGGLRKYRFAFDGRGKSGGVRILYVDFSAYGIIYMISLFAKSEKQNLNQAEKNTIRKMIAVLEKEVKEREAHNVK
jgi:hypothetical protein